MAVVALGVTAATFVARSGFAVEIDAVGSWLERRIASAIDPLGVRRGDLTLSWAGIASPVVVRAERWTLVRSDGEPLLELPSVEIALAQRPFLRGELQPLWAIVAGPRLSLDRDSQGVFVPSVDDLGAGGGQKKGGVSTLMDRWLAQSPSGPLAHLAWARIENATITVRDRALALDWGVAGLRAELSHRDTDQIELAGSLEVRHGAGSAATAVAVPFAGSFDLRARRLGLTLELPDLELKSVAALHPSLAPLADLDLRLGGNARVSLGAGELVADPIELTLGAAGAGEARADPVAVRASARWPVGSESFSLRASAPELDLSLLAPLSSALAAAAPLLPPLDAELALDTTAGDATLVTTLRAPGDQSPFSSLHGTVTFPPDSGPTDVAVEVETLRPWRLAANDPALAPLLGVEVPFDGALKGIIADGTAKLRLELTGGSGSLQISGVPSPPLAVDSAEIQGEIGGPSTALRLEHGGLALRAGTMAATGELRPREGGYSARVELTAAELGRVDLDRFWPPELAPAARARVADAFVSGAVRDLHVVAEVAVDLRKEPPARLDALDGSAVLESIALDVLAPQPPLEVSGSARFDLDSIEATVQRARLRDVEAGPGTARLTGLRGENPALAIDTPWRAPLESALALLAAEPLSLIENRERIAGVTGSTRGEVQVEIPLGAPAESKRARVSARGAVEDLEWRNGPLGLAVSRGELTFTYGVDAVEVNGKARFESSPARFSLRHRLDDAEPRDALHLTAQIDDGTARALGAPEQTFVGGTVGIDATYTGHGDGAAEVRADVDLTPARIELVDAGVSKSAGEAASARLDAAVDPEGLLTVRSFAVDGRQVAGTARLTATTGPFRLESATVESLRLGNSQLGGTLRRRADGGLTVAVDAERLDLRPLLGPEAEAGDADEGAAERPPGARKTAAPPRAATERPAPEAGGATDTERSRLDVPFDFDATTGSVLLLGEAKTQRFEAGGAWNGERWDRLSIHGAFDDETRLSLDYDRNDPTGGISFQATDLGRLLTELTSRAELRGGELQIAGKRSPSGDGITGHATLRSFTMIKMPVFARILKLGLNSLVGMFETKGLQFETTEADLEWDGRRLSVSNGRALGPGIALTGAGTFDLAAGTIDFEGTAAHMGTLQRILAKIPGISHLVLGPDKAGLIATQFHLEGALADPDVKVEPLSTLTPGILRGLFDGGKSGGSEGSKKRETEARGQGGPGP